MSEKRKDNKGRLLRTGESQRKDLTYQFRYTDVTGKRRTFYAKDLKELRKQEEKIQREVDAGVNYCEGNINVIELVERYVSLKQGVRHATKVGYNFVLNLIRKEDFCYRRINTIKTSDAKLWFMKLQKDGRGYSTITSVRGVVKPAFQMACDEDILRKNPFAFSLAGVVVNDTKKREALTPEEQEIFMTFVKADSHYRCYYDEFNVLLVGGYTGFLLLDKNGNPKVGLHLDHHMQWTMKKYRRTREEPLPTITPHVLRHTFCTNMANAGMDLKSLQYLMGHSDAGITMNVYTHASFAQAEQSMQKILKFEPKPEAKTG